MMSRQKRVWLFLLLIITVEIMIWASLAAAIRPLSPQAQVQKANSTATKGLRELVRLGSRPPNCEHECGRCEPCMAIQMPTTTDELRTQYANYEPEGWKCKCGALLSTTHRSCD